MPGTDVFTKTNPISRIVGIKEKGCCRIFDIAPEWFRSQVSDYEDPPRLPGVSPSLNKALLPELETRVI